MLKKYAILYLLVSLVDVLNVEYNHLRAFLLPPSLSLHNLSFSKHASYPFSRLSYSFL